MRLGLIVVVVISTACSGAASAQMADRAIAARPSDAQLIALYPRAELASNISGSAVVDCIVAPGATRVGPCRPADGGQETPFAKAADRAGLLFQVRPSNPGEWRMLRMRFEWTAPTSDARGPQARFEIKDLKPTSPVPVVAGGGVDALPPDVRPIADVDGARFVRTPTPNEISLHYPSIARVNDRPVHVELRCFVTEGGWLEKCNDGRDSGTSNGQEAMAFLMASDRLAECCYRVDVKTIKQNASARIRVPVNIEWPDSQHKLR